MRLGTMMLAVGDPVGFVSEGCATSQGGRAIVASSDHLQTNVSPTSDKDSPALDVEGRRVVRRPTVRRGGPAAVRRSHGRLGRGRPAEAD